MDTSLFVDQTKVPIEIGDRVAYTEGVDKRVSWGMVVGFTDVRVKVNSKWGVVGNRAPHNLLVLVPLDDTGVRMNVVLPKR